MNKKSYLITQNLIIFLIPLFMAFNHGFHAWEVPVMFIGMGVTFRIDDLLSGHPEFLSHLVMTVLVILKILLFNLIYIWIHKKGKAIKFSILVNTIIAVCTAGGYFIAAAIAG